jgi:hypothetical protein
MISAKGSDGDGTRRQKKDPGRRIMTRIQMISSVGPFSSHYWKARKLSGTQNYHYLCFIRLECEEEEEE